MINELKHMLELQDDLNKQVHPDWKNQGFEWYRAIWVECAELMDHHGYKWWKKQEPDRGQVILELIDIWHFGMADLLESGDDIEDIAIKIKRSLPFGVSVDDPLAAVEAFASRVLSAKFFDVRGFAEICIGFNLSLRELYIAFMCKNVLNKFRQDHGYKDKTYKKVWNGREDNEFLYERIISISLIDDGKRFNRGMQDCLYGILEREYASLN